MPTFWENMAYMVGDLGNMEESCKSPQEAWDFLVDVATTYNNVYSPMCNPDLKKFPMEFSMTVWAWSTMDRPTILK